MSRQVLDATSRLTANQISIKVAQFFFALGAVYSASFGSVHFGTSSMDKSDFRTTWKSQNPHWKDDPYFAYHPNIMRMAKKSDFDVIATRPAYFATKQLREKHGFSLQPPYQILAPEDRATALIELERDQEWDM